MKKYQYGPVTAEERESIRNRHDLTGTNLKERLRYHVTGAIERGEAKPIVEKRDPDHFTYQELKAHAERLAEALKLVWNDKNARFGMDKVSNRPISEIIREALAQWEQQR